MLEKIKNLEHNSLSLEAVDNWEYLNKCIFEYGNEFLQKIPKLPTYVAEDHSKLLEELPLSENPKPIEACLENIKKSVDISGINPTSGGHLGYIPGGGIPIAALGDYIAALTNRYSGVYFASPGAVRMENILIEWMAQIMGYPQNSGGNLTSGGSIATLIAVTTARKAHGLRGRDFEHCVVYTTSYTHHSAIKAIGIIGMEECTIRKIGVDDSYRMCPDSLKEAIKNDKKSGKIPWLLVSSAGNTDTGMVDPLDVVGDIAKQEGLWHHVDAAYGGFFALVSECDDVLKGLHNSDSIIIDPHKGLFIPYGSGAVLIKDSQKMRAAHSYQANYMQDADLRETSPADVSPEFSRHFRGLRLWLPLQILGIKVFREALEEKILLARYFYHEIQKINGIEIGPFPDLSIVIFRYIPKRGDANNFNQALVKSIQSSKSIFVTSTLVNDKFVLRLAVLSARTHVRHIDLLITMIDKYIKDIKEI